MISSSVFGQDVGTTEIKILEGFKPVIPQATRLNDNASFDDTLKKDRTQIFEISNKFLLFHTYNSNSKHIKKLIVQLKE